MGRREIDLTPYRSNALTENFLLLCKALRMPVMVVTALTLIIFFFNSIVAFYVGAIITLGGEYLQIVSASYIHKNRHFTVSGPYSHVRNPMYIGRFFIGLGFVIMSLNPYIIGGFIILFGIYAHSRTTREERILKGLFPQKSEPYFKEVPKWIPRRKKYSLTEARTPSWSWVKKNREDLNLYGLIAILIFIYFKLTLYPGIGEKIINLIK